MGLYAPSWRDINIQHDIHPLWCTLYDTSLLFFVFSEVRLANRLAEHEPGGDGHLVAGRCAWRLYAGLQITEGSLACNTGCSLRCVGLESSPATAAIKALAVINSLLIVQVAEQIFAACVLERPQVCCPNGETALFLRLGAPL